MRSASILSVFTLISLTLLLISTPKIVQGADDSNSGQLARTNSLDPRALSAALGNLALGVNDTRLQAQLSQLTSQLNNGDYSGAASTLVQLKAYANSQSGQNVPDSLKTLLNSLTVGPDGVSINPDTLASILSAVKPGGSSATSGNSKNPAKLSVDLQTLANLIQNIDPSLAQKLLDEASNVNLGGDGTSGISPGVNITSPNLQGNNAISPPAISPPELASAAIRNVPTIDPNMLIVPVFAGVLLAAVYLSRNRIGRVLGTQMVPGLEESDDYDHQLEGGLDSRDPRKRILFYFRRTVLLMRSRGVSKSRFDTHREFSSKCSGRQEYEHVDRISGLYEKAKFSSEEVTPSDADETARRVSMLENIRE